MRGADVARVARSPPAAAVGRASVRAICAAAGSCAGTPSTMIAGGQDHRPRGWPRAFEQGLNKLPAALPDPEFVEGSDPRARQSGLQLEDQCMYGAMIRMSARVRGALAPTRLAKALTIGVDLRPPRLATGLAL